MCAYTQDITLFSLVEKRTCSMRNDYAYVHVFSSIRAKKTAKNYWSVGIMERPDQAY